MALMWRLSFLANLSYMSKLHRLRLGLYFSLFMLLVSLGRLVWPFIDLDYFLQMAGLMLGVIGTAFFAMALAEARSEVEEER